VLCTAFLYLHFGYEIFCHKNIGAKGASKMLMKLTPSSQGFFLTIDICIQNVRKVINLAS